VDAESIGQREFSMDMALRWRLLIELSKLERLAIAVRSARSKSLRLTNTAFQRDSMPSAQQFVASGFRRGVFEFQRLKSGYF
jgi:hypothetical protein